jgi:hypothetical protein
MSTARAAAALAALLSSALPAISHADGTVERYRIDPHGRVAGVILTDGTVVSATPSQMDVLRTNVRPGDAIHVALGPRNSYELENTRTERWVNLGQFDQVARGGGPYNAAVPYAQVDDARRLGTYTVQGHVARILHTPNGDRSGFLMDNGAQVWVVPGVDGALEVIHPGDQLRVEGRGTPAPQGVGLWALTITRPNRVVVLDMTRGAMGVPELALGK